MKVLIVIAALIGYVFTSPIHSGGIGDAGAPSKPEEGPVGGPRRDGVVFRGNIGLPGDRGEQTVPTRDPLGDTGLPSGLRELKRKVGGGRERLPKTKRNGILFRGEAGLPGQTGKDANPGQEGNIGLPRNIVG